MTGAAGSEATSGLREAIEQALMDLKMSRLEKYVSWRGELESVKERTRAQCHETTVKDVDSFWPLVVAAVEQAKKDTAEKIAQAIHADRPAPDRRDARWGQGYAAAYTIAESFARSSGGTDG